MSERTDHAREMLEACDRLLNEIDGVAAPSHRSGECGCHDGVRVADLLEGLLDCYTIVSALRLMADRLEQQLTEGWILEGAVKDGQVNLVRGEV